MAIINTLHELSLYDWSGECRCPRPYTDLEGKSKDVFDDMLSRGLVCLDSQNECGQMRLNDANVESFGIHNDIELTLMRHICNDNHEYSLTYLYSKMNHWIYSGIVDMPIEPLIMMLDKFERYGMIKRFWAYDVVTQRCEWHYEGIGDFKTKYKHPVKRD